MNAPLHLSGSLPFPTSVEPPLSDLTTCNLYFDGTDLMLSEDGGAYVQITSGAVPSGWIDTGTQVVLQTPADRVAIGAGTVIAGEKLRVQGYERIDDPIGLIACLELGDGTNTPLSPAGEGRFRYNGTTNQFEVSENGGAWNAIAESGEGGWTDAGPVVRLTTLADDVAIGVATISAGGEKLHVQGHTRTDDPVGLAAFHEYGDGQNAAVAPVGEGRIRFNWAIGRFEESHNTLPWQALGVGTSGWIDDGPTVRLAVSGDNVSIGTTIMSGGGEKLRVQGIQQIDRAVGNEWVQILSQDAFSRYQIWHTAPNSVLRLGADVADGDAFDADSQGIVVYHVTNDDMARVKADRFGLTTSSDSANDYFFRADRTSLFYRANPPGGAVHFHVDRASGLVGINTTTQVGTEQLHVDGYQRIDDPSGRVAFLEIADGLLAPVANANEGRIRYNVNTQQFESSENGGAWAAIGASGWIDAGAVVHLATAADNVAIGVGAMLGGEKLRVVGDVSLSSDVTFEVQSLIHKIQGTQPSGFGFAPGDPINIIGSKGGHNNAGPPGYGGFVRINAGRGGDATSGSDGGGGGADFEGFGGFGGSATGAGQSGGNGGNSEIQGGNGGSGTLSADGGWGGEARLHGGQGGSGAVDGEGGRVSVQGGSGAFGNADGADVDITGGIGSGGNPDGDVNIGLSHTDAVSVAGAASELGFYGAATVVQPSAYTVSNLSADRVLDCNSTTLDELADILGTLLGDLKALGLVAT